ncbi:Rrf2 family transcriptional regulator [Leuconostoc litchii]|nr:Rrf2 family transcriptional regulator [Leuconostoc litchii]
MTYIAIYHEQKNLSSTTIAESVQVTSARVRSIMSALKKSNLIQTTNGQAKPVLMKSLEEISFYDIYASLKMNADTLFKVDQETEKQCIVGGNIQEVLTDEYQQLQELIEHKMREVTLATTVKKIVSLAQQKGQLLKNSENFFN